MKMSISEIKKYFIEADCSEIFSITESSYGYNRLVINTDIIDDTDLEIIFKCAIFSDRFKSIHNITDKEVNLLNNCYFGQYSYGISLDMKRPFGNSDIEHDIFKIYKQKYDEQECSDIIDRIIYLMQEFLTDLLEPYDKIDLDDLSYIREYHYRMNHKKMTPNYNCFMEGYNRKEKIKNILS